MKRTLAAVCSLFLVASVVAAAETDHAHAPAPAKNAAFDALKGLAGTWTGKAGPAGGETMDATVVYAVTGAGSALEERLFPGSPHEMVTMYHLDGKSVMLTHYCAAGNQPQMKLAESDGKSFHFKFSGGTNISDGVEHMHEAKIVILDADHLRAEWTSWKGGKAQPTMIFNVSRKQ